MSKKKSGSSKTKPVQPKKSAVKAVKKPVKAPVKPAPKRLPEIKSREAAKAAQAKAAAEKVPPKKPVTRADARFKVGEQVVYPPHGVGVITAIDRRNITGEDRWYYTINFRNSDLIVEIPIEQQDSKNMRRLVGKAEVEKIMAILKKKPPTEEADWKVRHNIYLEKLKSGDIYEAAKVARNLSKRGPEGELSMSEKKLLESSVNLLVHEIAHASGRDLGKVEDEINKCLRSGRT